MRTLRILPIPPRETQHSRGPPHRDIIHKRADRPRLLEPVALLQLARPDTLVLCCLEVFAAGHRSAVDGVVDVDFILEPQPVSPFRGLAVDVVSGVVVYQVAVAEVGVEG